MANSLSRDRFQKRAGKTVEKKHEIISKNVKTKIQIFVTKPFFEK